MKNIKQLTFDEFISKSKRHFPKYATNNDKVNKIFDIIYDSQFYLSHFPVNFH